MAVWRAATLMLFCCLVCQAKVKAASDQATSDDVDTEVPEPNDVIEEIVESDDVFIETVKSDDVFIETVESDDVFIETVESDDVFIETVESDDVKTDSGLPEGQQGRETAPPPSPTPGPPPPSHTPGPPPPGPKRPHIVMIVADDLGWNDVSWRDVSMHTPVLAGLARAGVVLNQSYVQPVCSPSRAAFMSGTYPYHLGMQHKSLRATQQAYLPDHVTTLPQHLQSLGYSTHMAGKWHLGFCNWRYTPTFRGFHSFVGFYNAIQDYYTHVGHRHGYDFRHNQDVYYDAKGEYSAYIFTRYVEQVISRHNASTPLFVYLPYQSVHGPLQVPQHYIDRYCSHVQNSTRRVHCGMVAALDEGVGNVTRALARRGMLDDTLLLFTTDNGGPVHEGANNWPLRGAKTTLWEGGTRATAFLHAPSLLGPRAGTVYDGVIHAVDWLPTLLEAAGGGGGSLPGVDGVSQWSSLLTGALPSARTEFVYNFDELKQNAAIRQGRYKLLQGPPGHPGGWYPPPHLDPTRRHSATGTDRASSPWGEADQRELERQALSEYSEEEVDVILQSMDSHNSTASDAYSLIALRHRLDVIARERAPSGSGDVVRMTSEDADPEWQLYDLEADPTERQDVKHKYPDVFKRMRASLEEYRKSLVPANFPPHDPASYPSHFNGVWSPGWC